MGLSGTSFGISCLFLGYKKGPKQSKEGCFRVFKGVLELPFVNICYLSSHSNHVNHPFKGCQEGKTLHQEGVIWCHEGVIFHKVSGRCNMVLGRWEIKQEVVMGCQKDVIWCQEG